MSVTTVYTTAGLVSALSHAVGGDRINLAPGTYSGVGLNNIHPSGMVTIASLNSSNQAQITDMVVNQSSNLTFNTVNLNAVGEVAGGGGPDFTWMTTVQHSSNIFFNNITAYGTPSTQAANNVSAINFIYDTNVGVAHSSFQYFHNAIDDYHTTTFSLTGSTFNHISDDGIHGGGSSYVTISGNSFTNIHEDATDLDHPDAIQFFTAGTTASATNFYIANNTYTRGDGIAAQGIFLRDEVGNIPFYNVTIINNNMTGSLYRGVSIMGGHGVNVSGNLLTSYMDNWTAVVLQTVTNASVTNNTAERFIYQDDVNLNQYGNLLNDAIPVPGTLMVHGPLALTTLGQGQALTALGQDIGVAGPDASLLLGDFGNVFAVPEPATWVMLLAGFAMAGLGIRIGKRRAKLA